MRNVIVIAVVFAAWLFTAAQEQKIRKVPASQSNASSGKEMYTAYCASCHGINAKGNGPAASALKTPPSDLTMLSKKNGGKFPAGHVYEVINGRAGTAAHGSSAMPAWGPVFRQLSSGHQEEVQQRITNVTDYIRSMQML
jgi:mono/diheme cytochrome c family protein